MLNSVEIRAQEVPETVENLTRPSHRLHRFFQPGYWYGDAVRRLRLGPLAKPDQVQYLLQGLSGDGKVRLTHDAGSQDRRPGWLVRFPVPESLSALWALAPQNSRAGVEKALWNAAQDTLSSLMLRVRIDLFPQTELKHSSLAMAAFQHRRTNNGNPRLEIQSVFCNLNLRLDGTVSPIQDKSVQEHLKSLQDIYINGLREWVFAKTRIALERHKDQLLVPGVPENVIHALREAPELPGKSDAKCRESTLLSAWRDIGNAHGFGEREAKDLLEYHQQQSYSLRDATELWETLKSEERRNSQTRGTKSPSPEHDSKSKSHDLSRSH